jgi:hypothetical protein
VSPRSILGLPLREGVGVDAIGNVVHTSILPLPPPPSLKGRGRILFLLCMRSGTDA